MLDDIPGHSIICNADYSKMLRAYSENLLERAAGSFTLSYPVGVYININGVQQYHHIGFGSDFFCICCGKHTHHQSNSEIKISDRVFYSRCIDCKTNDIRICSLGYVNRKLCWKGLASLMLLREYMSMNFVPSELFGYILGIVNNVSCKQHLMM